MRVLFVCTGNSFRSPVAEALARRFKPDLEVESAGTDPADHVAENGKKLLEEENALRYVKPSPDPLSERALKQADKIKVMEKAHLKHINNNYSVEKEKIENWKVKDPIGPGVEPTESFEKIKEKVLEL